MKIRLFIIDDHPLIVDGLVTSLGRHAGLVVAGSSSNPEQGLREILARKGEIDVVLLDISMPGMSGLEVCKRIKSDGGRPLVIFLTFLTDEFTRLQLQQIPHDGLYFKNSPIDELVEYVRQVHAGVVRSDDQHVRNASGTDAEPVLSRTEIIVLYYIAVRGLTSREISDILDRSEQTVIKHRKNLMLKLGIRNIQGLVWYAISKDLHINPPV